jgi:hypothetical protein
MRKQFAYVCMVLATALTGIGAAGQVAVAGAPRPILGVPDSFNRSFIASHLHNQAPSPDYFGICAQRGYNSLVCIDQAVAAIENARKHDHHVTKQAVILPNNFRRLSVAEQTFVITNLERVDRGLRPYSGLITKLNTISRAAAILRADPSPGFALMHTLGAGEWGSIWAADLGPLPSDYDWMYNDGYSAGNTINIACPAPGAPGCWGHRDNILYADKGYPVLTAGAGTAKPAGSSIAEILVGGYDKPPKYDYTWHRALLHGANGHHIAARFRR